MGLRTVLDAEQLVYLRRLGRPDCILRAVAFPHRLAGGPRVARQALRTGNLRGAWNKTCRGLVALDGKRLLSSAEAAGIADVVDCDGNTEERATAGQAGQRARRREELHGFVRLRCGWGRN